MLRKSPLSYIRPASLLLMLLFLSAGNHRALGPKASPGGQSVVECAASPKDCKKPVKYLGESKGCACFACEYRKRSQKILCTRNEVDKRDFKLMLPRGGSITD